MNRILLIGLVALFNASCSKQKEVSQLIVMFGSEVTDFDSIELMDKLSDGGSIGVSGEEYGGKVQLMQNGTYHSEYDSGGNVNIMSSEIKSVGLKGNVSTDLYFCLILQVFDEWPDSYDGVLLDKRVIPAGSVDFSLEIDELVHHGTKMLNKD
jgi:hypothetical protein